MVLTQQNAAAYVGQQLDRSRRLFHHYPLTVFQYNECGPFYVKDRVGVCYVVPDEHDRFNDIGFEFVVLASRGDFVLLRYVDYPDYYGFGSRSCSPYCDFPANQCGTQEEVKAELNRWLHEVDSCNPVMQEAEHLFLNALQ